MCYCGLSLVLLLLQIFVLVAKVPVIAVGGTIHHSANKVYKKLQILVMHISLYIMELPA